MQPTELEESAAGELRMQQGTWAKGTPWVCGTVGGHPDMWCAEEMLKCAKGDVTVYIAGGEGGGVEHAAPRDSGFLEVRQPCSVRQLK